MIMILKDGGDEEEPDEYPCEKTTSCYSCEINLLIIIITQQKKTCLNVSPWKL